MTIATTIKPTAIKTQVHSDVLLTEDDVKLLDKLTRAKKTVKDLQDHLKPRITAAIEEHGVGRLMVGNRQIELKRSTRQSVAWKPLVYSVVPEDVIDAVLESHTEPYNIDSAKVVV